jgi:uncharacterized repeat protein (TIGR03803 family)
VASLGRKSRIASLIFVVPALLLVSPAICASARTQSWDEDVLHSFDGTDGLRPVAGLIQGSDGNFYGTTSWGGTNFDPAGDIYGGTVFKLTPSGALTTLYSFCSLAGCADGAEPQGGLIQGLDGNFYGTASEGAVLGAYGTVFKLTPSGTLTTLYSFTGEVDGASPSAGLIQGSEGNFYGTTQFGGAHGEGNVFELTPSGTLTTLYSFCSTDYCEDGQWPIAGVIQGAHGNFYGTTYYGGAGVYGTVFQLTPSGTLTILYSFCSQNGCTDGAEPAAGVIQGTDGSFYGTTTAGGAHGGGTVFQLTPSGTLSTLYSFCSRAKCTDGAVPDAGVIHGSDGNFYGTTEYGGSNNDGTVFRLAPSGTLTTLYSFTGGTTAANPFAGLIQGSDGNFYGTTYYGGVNGDGTVFEVGASLARGEIKVMPTKLTLKAEPNAAASASITIQNTGAGPATVAIGDPKHNPPFSEVGGGSSIAIGPGGDYEVAIVYSPKTSTTNKEKSDSISITAISNDPKQQKPITVKLKGED